MIREELVDEARQSIDILEVDESILLASSHLLELRIEERLNCGDIERYKLLVLRYARCCQDCSDEADPEPFLLSGLKVFLHLRGNFLDALIELVVVSAEVSSIF